MNGTKKKRFWIFLLIYREHFTELTLGLSALFMFRWKIFMYHQAFLSFIIAVMVPQKSRGGIDCAPFVVRIITVVKQYRGNCTPVLGLF